MRGDHRLARARRAVDHDDALARVGANRWSRRLQAPLDARHTELVALALLVEQDKRARRGSLDGCRDLPYEPAVLLVDTCVELLRKVGVGLGEPLGEETRKRLLEIRLIARKHGELLDQPRVRTLLVRLYRTCVGEVDAPRDAGVALLHGAVESPAIVDIAADLVGRMQRLADTPRHQILARPRLVALRVPVLQLDDDR